MSTELVKWSEIDRQITTAQDLTAISELYTNLEAIRLIARDRKMGIAVVNRAVGYMIKAAIKGGEMYSGLGDDKGGDKGSSSRRTTETPKQQAEKALGKGRNLISKWVKLADAVGDKPEKIDEYVAEVTDGGREGGLNNCYSWLTRRPYTFAFAPLPEGKYNVIYADPPWYISDSQWEKKWGGAFDTIKEKYPRVKTDDLCTLAVEELAPDDCVLFLWTTHTFLPDAFRVAKAWGFKYNATVTWSKGSGWTIQGFHRSTEFCLYCLRGKINYKGKAFPALIEEKSTGHSVKPGVMREHIERRIPEPRVELFAREEHEGWVSWGNEIE